MLGLGLGLGWGRSILCGLGGAAPGRSDLVLPQLLRDLGREIRVGRRRPLRRQQAARCDGGSGAGREGLGGAAARGLRSAAGAEWLGGAAAGRLGAAVTERLGGTAAGGLWAAVTENVGGAAARGLGAAVSSSVRFSLHLYGCNNVSSGRRRVRDVKFNTLSFCVN